MCKIRHTPYFWCIPFSADYLNNFSAFWPPLYTCKALNVTIKILFIYTYERVTTFILWYASVMKMGYDKKLKYQRSKTDYS